MNKAKNTNNPPATPPTLPLILAIDTSCDDTSAAVVWGNVVLSNVIASQTQLHKPYGGVFPTVAKQAHRENIDRVIELALKKAGLTVEQLSALAVTQGPGLAPALEVGIEKATQLAKQHALPLIAVNHVEGHALSALAEARAKSPGVTNTTTAGVAEEKAVWTAKAAKNHNFQKYLEGNSDSGSSSDSYSDYDSAKQFPILAIVVSGGHTEFVKVEKIGRYQLLGETIDDAAGEALDKVGRMLNLGYPAGPVMEQFAKLGNPKRFNFPLPMTTSNNCNLSFSGLKTHARNLIEKLEANNELDKQAIYDFAASFQRAVFKHICHKLNKILLDNDFAGFLLGGGVAANISLRQAVRKTITESAVKKANLKTQNSPQLSLTQKRPKLLVPYSKRLCMDNAAMIGLVSNFIFAQRQIEHKTSAFAGKIDRQPRLKIA